ncbi:MAG: hypothetical protein ACT6XY_05175 [Phreatobacter sp.]|jgi:hypothetical protein|uniref:hypothetical protein n=1 Tax=Phreatobacter sp. TaxID=1966341 RepID=UPI0040351A63
MTMRDQDLGATVARLAADVKMLERRLAELAPRTPGPAEPGGVFPSAVGNSWSVRPDDEPATPFTAKDRGSH